MQTIGEVVSCHITAFLKTFKTRGLDYLCTATLKPCMMYPLRKATFCISNFQFLFLDCTEVALHNSSFKLFYIYLILHAAPSVHLLTKTRNLAPLLLP